MHYNLHCEITSVKFKYHKQVLLNKTYPDLLHIRSTKTFSLLIFLKPEIRTKVNFTPARKHVERKQKLSMKLFTPKGDSSVTC